MADPICRWRNPYFPTVRELISILPTENLPKDIGRQLTNEAFGSEDFFRTPYQLAAQLGLYYEDDLMLYTKFHNKPHPFEIDAYIDSWFKKYYVPNPYTARGFANIQPKILFVDLCKLLYDAQESIPWTQVKDSLFGEEIGNDDILVNVINTYSRLFQVKNKSLQLKDGIVYEDLISSITSYTLPERNDKKGFFDHFSTEFTVSNNYETVEFSDQEIIHSFAEWLNAKPKNNYYENDYKKTVLFLNRLQEKYSEAFAQSPFDVDFEELEGFVSKIDKNIWDQESGFWVYSQATSNHLPRAVLNKDNYQAFLREFHNRSNQTFLPKNTIYYGAPGTGKSYIVDQKIKNLDPTYFERVTFHPEYDNAAFIGGYKPVSIKNEEGKDEISYRFVPQAFSAIYSRAWADPDNQYYLVIEEINRGNCAEIFGEIFQLLDRNSGYTVTPSKELHEYLLNKFSDTPEHPGITKGLKLPPNLNIIATMNTSDQSLFPMDSAFKRRWEWEYVPICYDRTDEDGELNPSYDFEIDIEDGRKYRWIDFISKINNNHIKNNPSLGMDKCIGNYFIKPDNGNSITLKPFINKVIFYLWNDVFKDEDNKVFEPNGSYEDFFPVASAGTVKIKELFERIELSPIAGYREKEEEEELGRVAEENHTLGL